MTALRVAMPHATSAGPKSYHHGNLRDALVAAAEALVTERASWTFTLREVARAAGVSHNAPYNHFADRRALLAAVAARGFDRLTSALEAALHELGSAEATVTVQIAGRAYLAFAMAHPSSYRLMFSAELAGHNDAALEASGAKAFGVLRGVIEKGVAAGTLRGDADGTHALAAWSLVHGLAVLALDERIATAPEGPTVAALATSVCATLVEGLAKPARL